MAGANDGLDLDVAGVAGARLVNGTVEGAAPVLPAAERPRATTPGARPAGTTPDQAC